MFLSLSLSFSLCIIYTIEYIERCQVAKQHRVLSCIHAPPLLLTYPMCAHTRSHHQHRRRRLRCHRCRRHRHRRTRMCTDEHDCMTHTHLHIAVPSNPHKYMNVFLLRYTHHCIGSPVQARASEHNHRVNKRERERLCARSNESETNDILPFAELLVHMKYATATELWCCCRMPINSRTDWPRYLCGWI